MSLPALDQPEVLRVIFHPRPEYALVPPTSGAYPVSIKVEPQIAIGARLFPAGREAPAILYWHGNGEIAADYDGSAAVYTQLGITLLVADYRGYGTSDGTPTCSNLLTDAVAVFGAADEVFADYDLVPARRYVMGRSLGSAAAIEVAVHAGEELDGLIVESGFADTLGLLARLAVRLEGADEASDGFDNAAKIARVTIPTLIIHGQNDVLIPAEDGKELYHRSAAEEKDLVLIPGAGHNDLMMLGRAQYFQAIRRFVQGEKGG
jgi:alpha-beta hydrolase superfamily lysophospholipase